MIRTDKGHFYITFDNGYILSIFNGFGSYSENHFNHELHKTHEYLPIASKDCEIAIIYEGELVTNNVLQCGDNVKGYVTPNELVEIINKVSKLGD